MINVIGENLYGAANICSKEGQNPLTAMFGADETLLGKGYAIYCLFEDRDNKKIKIIRADFEVDKVLEYPSLTPLLPAAAWYEREIYDMFGIKPIGHPDLRPLVLHQTFPEGYHPLLKNVSATKQVHGNRNYNMITSSGEGVFEVAVGPIHAGIIEPGHFRFSQAGESMLQLDAKLFYTHRGIEKTLEGMNVNEAIYLIERVCGACSVSNTLSYCMAIEKLSEVKVSRRAWLIRMVVSELERLYNHVSDTGNLSSGVGFSQVVNQGSALKEKLMRCNEVVTGSRFLRGMIALGGVNLDIDYKIAKYIEKTLKEVEEVYPKLFTMMYDNENFLNRIKTTGIVRTKTAKDLAMVGVGARGSGIATDSRKDLVYGLYNEVEFDKIVYDGCDVEARLLVRGDEVFQSIKIIRQLLAKLYELDEKPSENLKVKLGKLKTETLSYGLNESARGSNLNCLILDKDEKIYRCFIRSASYPNWPSLPIAIQGDIIPDFPLINKSFELCYACLDR